MAIEWYFDDFVVGASLSMGSCAVTEEEILTFARQFDPQPFHIDPDAAKQTIFGGIIASGWHTCGMMMRLVTDNLLNQSSSMGSPGLDQVQWLKPVRAGDTLSVTYVVDAVKASTSKPDRGVVVATWQAHNQHGEVVTSIKCKGMFGRRPAAA
jgi:acyl dehydratase